MQDLAARAIEHRRHAAAARHDQLVAGNHEDPLRPDAAERKRAAEKYRSEGVGKSAEIEGQIGKELKQITSEAYRTAQAIVGKADAEAVNIYAASYSRNPEFYSFMKTLETYRDTVDKQTTLILTTDSDYYKYLKGLD